MPPGAPMNDESTEPAAAAPTATILVVDDDASNLESVARIFQKEFFAVLTARNGEGALDLLRHEHVNVLVTDLAMPGLSGTDLLRACKAVSPETEVVLMTAYGTVETAVGAMKEGAYDFLTKPLRKHALVKSVQKALEKQQLVEENRALRARVAQLAPAGGLVGNSPAFRATMDIVRQAA